jgi:hypothetical protein
MALTRSDKEDIQQMHDVTINHIREILTLTTNNLKTELVEIKEQTTKTNGRVTSLERNLPHTALNCPHTSTINTLRDLSVEKAGEKKWKSSFRVVLTVFLSFVGTLITVFAFLKLYNP